MELKRKTIDPANITSDTQVIEARLISSEEIKNSRLIHRAGDYVGRTHGWFGKKQYATRNIWEVLGNAIELFDKCADSTHQFGGQCQWSNVLKENDSMTHLIYKSHIDIVLESGAIRALFFNTLEETIKVFDELVEKYNLK